MSSTTYAKRTQYKPIDFFYRGISDIATKKVVFVDAFQILNDRYLGRMSVCNYFCIAENSVRINELNVIALDELRNYHLVMCENFCIPEKTVYSLPITTRFLEGERDFDVLVATLKENGYKKDSLILNFNSATLIKIDDEAKARYNKLRRMGFKTCVSGFGDEFNSLDIFAHFTFNYLRVEASYFDASVGKKKLLNMLVKFCTTNKITLVMEGVDTPSQKTRFKKEGVKLVTGKAASKLSRYVTNEFLKLPQLGVTEKEAYLAKLRKQLDTQERKEQAEIENLRQIAIEKAKSYIANGKVMPSAPRPELLKSPYQVRLEKQKQLAKKSLLEREKKLANKNSVQAFDPTNKNSVQAGKDNLQIQPFANKNVIQAFDPTKVGKADQTTQKKSNMSFDMFEGGVQSALAISFATDMAVAKHVDKSKADKTTAKLNVKNNTDTTITKNLVTDENTAEVTEVTTVVANNAVTDETAVETAEVTTVVANNAVTDETALETTTMLNGNDQNNVESTTDETALETTEVKDVGHYNDEGQWVDEDGFIYNGYFDESGNWVEYETFDAKAEGSYNDDGQWTDSEGNVYDGYFDENGRFIDYSYEGENGEVVSNGYFDTKIKKWIPFGYFDENDTYISF